MNEIDKFLQYIAYEMNLSPRTVRLYRDDLRQWEQFATDAGARQLDVASVTAGDIRAWVVERANQGDSAGTLRHKVQALRAFFRYLLRSSVVATNPAKEVTLAKLPRRLPKMVRDNTMDAILDAPLDETDFTATRDRLIVMLFYETGIRRAELITLMDANVDTQACRLKVRGKRNKDRIVPFGDELRRMIDVYRQLRGEVAPECDNLLVTAKGKPLYPSLVYHIVHDTLAEAGATGKLSPHVLRHSYASTLLNHGAEINSVKELLGHESLAATQVYTHVTLSELQHNYQLAHPRALKKQGE